MAVAHTYSMETQVPIIGFSSNGTKNPDAFIIINWDKKWDKIVELKIKGTSATKFHGFRTDNKDENYKDIGILETEENKFPIELFWFVVSDNPVILIARISPIFSIGRFASCIICGNASTNIFLIFNESADSAN